MENKILQRLIDGNKKYAEDKFSFENIGKTRRREVFENGQHPFATILTCSDSRVVPEFIFNCGIGELFTVRVAGSVLDKSVIGSVEYAVKHLKTPVLVVLGHQHCGAVTAAFNNSEEPCDIKFIVDEIKNSMKDKKTSLDEVIDENTDFIKSSLMNSEVIASAVKKNEVLLVGAYYSLETGKVTFYL